MINEDEFKTRLKQFLIELDLDYGVYPDPEYAGKMAWEYYLQSRIMGDNNYNKEMDSYEQEFSTAKKEQERKNIGNV